MTIKQRRKEAFTRKYGKRHDRKEIKEIMYGWDIKK